MFKDTRYFTVFGNAYVPEHHANGYRFDIGPSVALAADWRRVVAGALHTGGWNLGVRRADRAGHGRTLLTGIEPETGTGPRNQLPNKAASTSPIWPVR